MHRTPTTSHGFKALALVASVVFAVPVAAQAQDAAVRRSVAPTDGTLARLVREHSHALHLSDAGELDGPGALFLREVSARAQFVALGEDHNIREVPLVTTALFRLLNTQHGFEYFATEQDPLMLEWLSADAARGGRDSVRALGRRYPHGFTFATDQELTMLADIAAQSRAGHRPLWGAEQAPGATHYLDALRPYATTPEAARLLVSLRASARASEGGDGAPGDGYFMQRDRGKRSDLERLRTAVAPRPGSRAEFLLATLLMSDSIYALYARAVDGEPTGLASNWTREDYMKRRFLAEYRLAEAVDRREPKVLLKYGGWHIRRGRGPGGVFTLGTLMHELAIANGHEALTVSLVAYPERALLEKSLFGMPWAPLVPDSGWMVVDLRPLRAYAHAGRLRDEIPEQARQQFYDTVFGYDLMIFVAGATDGTYEITRRTR